MPTRLNQNLGTRRLLVLGITFAFPIPWLGLHSVLRLARLAHFRTHAIV